MKQLLTLVLLAASASASQAVLLAHFELNEASGHAVDSSANAFPTTAVVNFSGMSYGQASVPAGNYGAITIDASQSAAFGTAIDFGTGNLDNGHFALQGAAATSINGLMQPGTSGRAVDGAMTVMAWVNLNDAPNLNQTIFSSGTSRTGWKLGTLNGRLLFTLIGKVDYLVPLGLVPGQWYHLAMTAQDGELSFYLNGNLMQTRTASVGFNDENSSGLARLGFGAAGSTEPMFGRMDEVKIFDTALDASALAAAALPMAPVPEPGTALMSAAGLVLLGAWVKRQCRACPVSSS